MAQLQRAKVYRNVELRQQWLGLEPFDALALGGVARASSEAEERARR